MPTILAGETKVFALGPSTITMSAPEDCECERQTDDHVIITLTSLPECRIHLDKVPYDSKLGQYYSRDRSLFDILPKLREDISEKFGFDPMDEFGGMQPNENNDVGWRRMWWRADSEDDGLEVWLKQLEPLDGWMFRVMAGKLTEEEVSHIRSLVKNIAIEI